MEDEFDVEPMERPLVAGGVGPEDLTLINARNGFNELSRMSMLWRSIRQRSSTPRTA